MALRATPDDESFALLLDFITCRRFALMKNQALAGGFRDKDSSTRQSS